MSRQYCYSTNEQEFTGECDTRDAAVLECAYELGLETGTTVYTAEIIRWEECITDGLSIAEDIEERVDEFLAQETGAEETCFTFLPELRDQLGRLVMHFVLENGKCDRWKTENIQSHRVPEAIR